MKLGSFWCVHSRKTTLAQSLCMVNTTLAQSFAQSWCMVNTHHTIGIWKTLQWFDFFFANMHTYKTKELWNIWVWPKIPLEVTRGQFKVIRVTGEQTLKTTSSSTLFCMYAPMTDIINKYYLKMTSTGIEGHWRSN